MIKELIATLMISTGVAYSTPTFNNSETKPPLLANTNNVSFSLEPTLQTSASAISSVSYGNYTDYIQNFKANYQGYNNACLVNATFTIASRFEGAIDDHHLQISTATPTFGESFYPQNYAKMYQYTNMMLAMQLTPYQYITDANNNIRFSISFTLTSSEDLDLYIQVDTYTSVDDNWQNYIDTTTYATTGYNYSVISELTSSENGYAYNHETQTKSYTYTNGTSQVYEVETDQEIEVVAGVDNYIYLFFTPYTTSSSYSYMDTATKFWARLVRTNPIIVSGTMIIPPSSYEVVDIPGLCFNILTMPFVFISTAFNLTIFPGTPYQFNLANLFMAIIGVLVFIFILKIFVKNKFGG